MLKRVELLDGSLVDFIDEIVCYKKILVENECDL